MQDTRRPAIRALRIFDAVARGGGIGKGAEELLLSQPAVTHCIKSLEALTGELLFVRNGRGVALTPAGEVFHRRVQRYFLHLRLGFSALRRQDGEAWADDCVKRMSEPHMRCLIAAAESSSLSEAAQRLGLSEATLSKATKEIGAILGDATLFQRSRFGISCTPRGRELARRFKLARVEIDDAFEDLAELRGLAQGRIAIGALPLAGAQLLSKSITAFSEMYPQARFLVLQDLYDSLLAKLRAGELDFIVGVLWPQNPADDVAQEPLLTDPYVVAARQGHPLARLKEVSVDQLMARRWVLPSSDSPRRLAFSRIAGLGQPAPIVDIETSSLRHTRSILLQSDRMTLLTESELMAEVEAGTLSGIAFPVPGERRIVGITAMADRLQTRLQTDFLALLRQMASYLGEHGGQAPAATRMTPSAQRRVAVSMPPESTSTSRLMSQAK